MSSHNHRISYVEFQYFLALLDYLSRAHEIEIRPSSVIRRTVVRLWHRLSLKLLDGLLEISVVASPGPYAQNFFHF